MAARTQTQPRAFDPRRWVLLATLALLAPTAAAQRTFEEFADDTRAAILDGLERIPAPGVPGRVAVFGEHALSVFALEKAGAPRTVIAAARPRRGGRVVTFGHGGYLSRSTLEDEHGGRLVRQALEWAAGDLLLRERDRVFLIGAPALREPLEEWGYEVELRDRLDDEPQLVILGRVDLDEAEQERCAVCRYRLGLDAAQPWPLARRGLRTQSRPGAAWPGDRRRHTRRSRRPVRSRTGGRRRPRRNRPRRVRVEGLGRR
ncbi:MAG: hypothetical protein ACYTFV_06800 [Planctomycetota bacterium]